MEERYPDKRRLWEVADERRKSAAGRPKKFKDTDQIWNGALEYFQWIEDNPLMESKLVTFQGVSTIEQVPKMRAMTMEALHVFLDCSSDCWREYKKDEKFSPVCNAIEKMIYNQKFTGAAADMLNSNIIARDLGLTDKQDVKHDGELVHKIERKIVRASNRNS